MKSRFQSWSMTFACLSLAGFVGCNEPAAKAPAPAATGEQHAEGDGHEHGEEGHADHDHPSEGPHHGHLIELGEEEYHAELTHDDATGKVTIYLLDSGAKNSVPIAAEAVTINLVTDGKPKQFTLPAVADENDPAGKSSRFEVADEELHEALEAENAKGRLNITIEGKDYVGTIEHAAHGEHEHEEHDHKD